VTKCGFASFTSVKDLDLVNRKIVKKILDGKHISRLYEEEGIGDDMLQALHNLQMNKEESNVDDVVIEVHTRALYQEIMEIVKVNALCQSYGVKPEAMVNTKYKTVAKKIKPVAIQLPLDTEEHIRQVEKEPSLRETRKIGHKFTKETLANLKIGGGEFLTEQEKKKFREMISKHGKAFASSPDEIGCVQPSVVAPMVIFTVPHVPWDLKPIPVPQALLPKLVDLLKKKVHMGILKPSIYGCHADDNGRTDILHLTNYGQKKIHE
jgi:hypothetical protein